MASTGSKVGHGLAKVLGIKLDRRDDIHDKITRGESVFSVSSADTFVEEEPSVLEWFQEQTPSMHDMAVYSRNLFPFTHWIGRYNLQWLTGDLVAGITIGAVVVPQGMAYAQLAQLPVEYGLYTSFMGVLIYWFFATSKDITIGVSPVQVSYIVHRLTCLMVACGCHVYHCWKHCHRSQKDRPTVPRSCYRFCSLYYLRSNRGFHRFRSSRVDR